MRSGRAFAELFGHHTPQEAIDAGVTTLLAWCDYLRGDPVPNIPEDQQPHKTPARTNERKTPKLDELDDFIREKPGLSLAELASQMGRAVSTICSSLKVLEESGRIVRVRREIGYEVLQYPLPEFAHLQVTLEDCVKVQKPEPVKNTDLRDRILNIITTNLGLNLSDIATLAECSLQTAGNHTRAFDAQGLIRRERIGFEFYHFPPVPEPEFTALYKQSVCNLAKPVRDAA
jgi:DNA-binding MarR family transcriptional regulator